VERSVEMIKAHKIRLHPTTEQATYFAKAAGTARFCYNWAVAEWRRQYEAGENPSVLKLRAQFHAVRKEQFPWSYDVTKCAIEGEGAFMDVGSAFKNFFEGRKEDLTLADRVFVCPDPDCGYVGDRDENAAYNIVFEALRMFGLNLNMPSGVVATTRRKTAWGLGVRPT